VSNILEDKKSNCLSILENLKVKQYLDIINAAYSKKGGINGQRMPLKTKTAQTIRSRMVEDISLGAILPPMVVGLIVEPEEYRKLSDKKLSIFDVIGENISLIDGMQRTTAIKEALEKKSYDYRQRVESRVLGI
jgi:hypothetical protein